MLPATKLTAHQKRLHTLRARLDTHAAELREVSSHGSDGETGSGSPNATGDTVDRAAQEVEVTVSIELAENEAFLRTEIDAALNRIEERTYGICEECGQEIDARRLNAVPYARYCIQCERRIEQEPRP